MTFANKNKIEWGCSKSVPNGSRSEIWNWMKTQLWQTPIGNWGGFLLLPFLLLLLLLWWDMFSPLNKTCNFRMLSSYVIEIYYEDMYCWNSTNKNVQPLYWNKKLEEVNSLINLFPSHQHLIKCVSMTDVNFSIIFSKMSTSQ